jgi:hypothetical protein
MLPDVVDFASDVLMAKGGLVEKDREGVLAVLPAEVARLFGLPESCILAPRLTSAGSDSKQVPCNFGTPALERLIDVGRSAVPAAACRLNLEPPRPSQACSLADRFAPRNGLSEIVSAGVAEADYLVSTFAWAAEADDRYEGLLHLVMCGEDAAEPDESFQALVDPVGGAMLTPATRAAEGPGFEVLLDRIARRLMARLGGAIQPVTESIRRRHFRDHERITDYFASMIGETLASRRRVDAETLGQKVNHLLRERDAKLRELPNRFAVRLSVSPVAFLWIATASAVVDLRLRRRKESRALRLRLPPGAQLLDRLACDGCAGSTARPALCDDRLHLLCADCAPSAQGRLKCPACALAMDDGTPRTKPA